MVRGIDHRKEITIGIKETEIGYGKNRKREKLEIRKFLKIVEYQNKAFLLDFVIYIIW